MRGDPKDLKNLSEDLQGVLQRHPDAVRNNPDIATEIVKTRDKAIQRYEQVTEHRDEQ